MKTNINLYHASCQPKKLKCSFVQLGVLCFFCLLSLACLKGLLVYQANVMQEKQQAASNTLDSLHKELALLVVQLQANAPPLDKVIDKNQLNAEVAAKQTLLSNLNQIDLGLVVSFSELMRGLSKVDLDQVSIEQFSIVDGKLNIQGKAKYSDSVPLWLTRTQKLQELQKLAFEGVEITQQDGVFLFQLNNVALGKKSKDFK